MRSSVNGRAGRGGFSLIEVALALTVAAGGMVAIFGLFPGGLRQGMNSNRDLVGASFAGSALAAMAGNVRTIDDVETWNDPEKWWKRAVEGTGLPAWNKALTPERFTKDESIFLPNRSKVADVVTNAAGANGVVFFFADDDGKRTANNDGISLPPHYIIRLARVRRKPRSLGSYSNVRGYSGAVDRLGSMTSSDADAALKKVRAPDRYLVSIVSSDQKGYSIFVNEPVYSQEFFFLHRP